MYDPRQDLGVFAFRRRFTVTAPPKGFRCGVGGWKVRVSADNRYRLYCNGKLVGRGPQRGDERHWFYETIDLEPYLVTGENELVALVWNFGWLAPMAQHTVRTAFVLEDLLSPVGEGFSTPSAWEVAQVEGWDFKMMHSGVGDFYIDVGPGEIIRGSGPGTGDLLVNLSSLEWREPNVICNAEERGTNGGGTPWMLIPATLPPQRYELRSELPLPIPDGEGAGGWGDSVYDFQELLCAYPRFHISGPAGTEVTVTYAESMWVIGSNDKGNRSEYEGKEVRGYQDKFILSGSDDVFEPLWWRTFRFMGISTKPCAGSSLTPQPPLPQRGEGESRVTPPPNPLPINGEGEPEIRIQIYETGCPYAVESSFEADDPWVKPIWDVSVRTAQRCAGETYFDCPYYEQLQYVGDSRIQALIGYYLGRDRALPRNCVDQIGWSIMDNGLTQSRYPSRQTQVIPPFSLWWVMMLYDQMLYDQDYLRQTDWLAEPPRYPQGLIRTVTEGYWNSEHGFWPFTDWCPEWPAGVAPGGWRSAPTSLLAVTASLAQKRCLEPFEEGGWLSGENWFVHKTEVERWFFKKDNGLVGQKEPKTEPASEHAEALYRIFQMMALRPPDPWPTEALAAANAAKCTYYFSYYKHLAMFGGQNSPHTYMELLAPWKEQIENGLTTFAENPEPTRSDCHAWSAHPILGFFQIVAGVTSTAPGWKRACIAPNPGDLKRFAARIAHPDGDLSVCFEDQRFLVDSPVPFEFRWEGKSHNFEAGRHDLGR